MGLLDNQINEILAKMNNVDETPKISKQEEIAELARKSERLAKEYKEKIRKGQEMEIKEAIASKHGEQWLTCHLAHYHTESGNCLLIGLLAADVQGQCGESEGQKTELRVVVVEVTKDGNYVFHVPLT